MSPPSKPIAKLKTKDGEMYFQTLEGHTVDALRILKAYIQRNCEVISQFCERWELEKDKFLENVFLTIYFHDIGKLTRQFQENIRRNKTSQKYPHAYYGFFLLQNSFRDPIIEVPIELAAILGHHTQLYGQIYSDRNLFEEPEFLREEIGNFVRDAEKVYRLLKFDDFFKFKGINLEIPEFSWNKIDRLRKHIICKVNRHLDENRDWEKIKSIFSYLFSILKTCDNYASANFSRYVENYVGNQRIFDEVLENPQEYTPILEVNDPIRKVLGDREPYEFQKALIRAPKFAILFAPCGRGKTEAALIWGLNSLKKHKRNKIIFAMPTQTTSNAMYDRIKSIFGEESVGLYHGRSFIKLKDEKVEIDDEEEEDIEEIKSESFKGSIFFKPITITTVDHLIYSFVKGFSQADFAIGNLQNAVIVFDEVHYYEKSTLEHLITLFEILRKMDIPHLLMSGTLPEFMVKKLGEYEYITDDEGLSYKPFKIEVLENKIIWSENKNFKVDERLIEEIITNYDKGLTQFIILNTVERAKQFYLKLKEKLSDQNIMLYHSQFTYSDRISKENEIQSKIRTKPFVLVATQVIEISLDISCDVMYSELAPPDALGQRAGRLNRKAKTWKDKVEHVLKIYVPENYSPYEEELLRKALSAVKRYEGPVSYRDIKQFCDEVYENYSLEIPSDLNKFFRHSTIFGYNWRDITYNGEEGRSFKVRDEKIQHIDVVPEIFYEKEGEKGLKIENMAKIPIYYIKKSADNFYLVEIQKGKKKRIYRICRYPYSYEVGFNYGAESGYLYLI
jgi:CRISPR-associated endonuclease/helicase Cas3